VSEANSRQCSFSVVCGYYQQPTTSNVQRLLSREAFTGGEMFFPPKKGSFFPYYQTP